MYISIGSLYSLLVGITKLILQRYGGNGTSCRPQPPKLLPQQGGSSITPLRKPPLCSSTSLLAYQGFKQEPPHRRGYPSYQDPQ